jgi:hypothetical protein
MKMARPGRFELPTLCLEGRGFVQGSCERAVGWPLVRNMSGIFLFSLFQFLFSYLHSAGCGACSGAALGELDVGAGSTDAEGGGGVDAGGAA